MKKTGSIRVNVQDYNTSYYQATYINIYGDPITFLVDKSAVTDIREEVDWSKVKKGAPIAVRVAKNISWDSIEVYFFTEYENDGITSEIIASSVYCDALAGNGNPVEPERCMPLDQWLKEHGGQDE